MSVALPHATDEQAARAIAHVSCVLLAAKNGNQHNENMVVLMDQATRMFQVLSSAHAWIEHWQRDVAGNLKPTPESLATAAAEIRSVLKISELV